MTPPARGRTVGAYLPTELIAKLDAWAAKQRRPLSRSEAVRLLLLDRLKNE